MSIWDTIKNGLEDAGNAIAHAGESVFDFSKKVLTTTALAVADGSNLFTSGWQDVFSGSFKEGLSKVAIGFGEVLGVVPPNVVQQYENAIGQSSLWALQQSKTTNQQVCFSAYRDQTKANIIRLGLEWNDGMEQKLRDGINQMPWINPNC